MSAVTHLPSHAAQCDRCGAACLTCLATALAQQASARQAAPVDELPPFLTIAQVAERLSVSPRKVAYMVDAGEIATVRIGRSVRIPADAYRAYCESLT